MAERFDAIIIGAGIIGAAVGLELARKGWRTLNLDKLAAAGHGSTSNSCAIIRVYYSTVDGTALAFEAYHDWLDWPGYLQAADTASLARYHNCGTLVMKTAGNGYCESSLAIMRQLGIAFEDWDAAKIKSALPVYVLDCYAPPKRLDEDGFGEPTGGRIGGGVFFPTGGYVSDPQLATQNIQVAAQAAGGAFRFRAEVTEVLRKDGRVAGVRLINGSEIEAPVVVNVGGPHSQKLNALASVTDDMAITTRPLRQEVVHVPSPKAFDFERDGLVISDNDIGVYARPEIGSHILLGSDDPPCDPHQEVDPDDFERNLTDQATTQLYRYAQRMPDVPIPQSLKGVVDLYDVTEDWIPIYDKSALPGWYMAIGTSGNQFKNAPVVGRMMASLIEACEGGHDHDADPLQFPLRYLEHTIDMATFSRRRKINPDSSFSVLG